MTEYLGQAQQLGKQGLTLGGKLLTAALSVAVVVLGLFVVVGSFGGAHHLSAAQATSVQFVGKQAVAAQEAVEKQVLSCGESTHTITAIRYVDPPFKAIGVTTGSAANAGTNLVGCLTALYVPKGATVDLCPAQAANADGIAPGRLQAFVTGVVGCVAGQS